MDAICRNCGFENRGVHHSAPVCRHCGERVRLPTSSEFSFGRALLTIRPTVIVTILSFAAVAIVRATVSEDRRMDTGMVLTVVLAPLQFGCAIAFPTMALLGRGSRSPLAMLRIFGWITLVGFNLF